MEDFFEKNALGMLLQIVGSLGIFIYGMKIMSEGLQKLAGDGLRKLLKGMTSNRFFGVLTGLGITVLIQSSSATTVMVVSFVNAGLLTLAESFGVIMGANIGTTITAWLLAIFGFKMKINLLAIALIAVFFPFMFLKNEKMRNLSEFVIGFGILFIGLTFLKDAVPNPGEAPWMDAFAQSIASIEFKYVAIFIFIFLGTLLTVVVQSSSAATAITLTLLANNIIPFDLACAMVLGENIGTTITANIAAMIGNVHAKRSARFHFFFNMIGVVWALIIFIPFTNFIQDSTGAVYNAITGSLGTGVIEGKDSVLNNINLMSMALFHTAFNVTNVLLLFMLVPQIAKLVIKITPSDGDEDEEFKLQFISSGLMSTPSLSLSNAKKELDVFAKLIDKMAHNVFALFFEKQKNPEKLIEKIRKREDLTDTMYSEMTSFLSKVAEKEINNEDSNLIRNMLRICNDLERMGDIYREMTKNFERLKREKANLPANAKEEVREIMIYAMDAIAMMRQNMSSEKENVAIEKIIEKERAINNLRKNIFINHFSRLEKGVYSPKVGVLFIDFINRSERLGDHVMNVHEAVLGVSDLYESVDEANA